MADPQRICSVPGCGKPFNGRGLCQGHLRRLRLYGDPLACRHARRGDTWRFIEGVAQRHDSDDCLLWPFGGESSKAYPQVMRGREVFSVTRMMCEARNGPPPAPDLQAAHSCGNGRNGCVNPRHLRWATAAENNNERRDHGTMPIGERSGTAKLTECEARHIKAMRGSVSQRKLAEQFGVSSTAVHHIHSGRSWGWIE